MERTLVMCGRPALIALMLTSLSILAIGCETISQDLDSFAKDIIPPSPREAAEMMNDPHDPDRRRRGTVLIANAPFGGAEPYVRLYRLRVEGEDDPTVLAASIRALGRHGKTEDAELIAGHLDHENVHVRWAAAEALQRIHNPEVVGDMLEVLRDESQRADIRTELARGLGQYPEPRVYQALVGALDHRSLSLNMAARHSLKTLTGEDFGYEMRRWYAWFEEVQQSDGDPFANRQQYKYPTYQRDETLIETLAFWSENNFEKPAPPIGLRPKDTRSTYGDDAGDAEQEDSEAAGQGAKDGESDA